MASLLLIEVSYLKYFLKQPSNMQVLPYFSGSGDI